MKFTMSKSQWELIGKKTGWIKSDRKQASDSKDTSSSCKICKKKMTDNEDYTCTACGSRVCKKCSKTVDGDCFCKKCK
jgi:uncharacterized paraquat-inducible protein A